MAFALDRTATDIARSTECYAQNPVTPNIHERLTGRKFILTVSLVPFVVVRSFVWTAIGRHGVVASAHPDPHLLGGTRDDKQCRRTHDEHSARARAVQSLQGGERRDIHGSGLSRGPSDVLIGPAMAPIAGDRFIDATDLFRDDPQEIFVDLFGHTYERANPSIVDALMPILGAAVLRVASPSSAADTSDGGQSGGVHSPRKRTF